MTNWIAIGISGIGLIISILALWLTRKDRNINTMNDIVLNRPIFEPCGFVESANEYRIKGLNEANEQVEKDIQNYEIFVKNIGNNTAYEFKLIYGNPEMYHPPYNVSAASGCGVKIVFQMAKNHNLDKQVVIFSYKDFGEREYQMALTMLYDPAPHYDALSFEQAFVDKKFRKYLKKLQSKKKTKSKRHCGR